jgi:HisJ family histidinol phosphate phosphatase
VTRPPIPCLESLVIDNHVHTTWSGHADESASAAAMRRAGLQGGLRISLREHAPLPRGFALGPQDSSGPAPSEAPASTRLSLHDRSLNRFFEECLEAGLSIGFEVDVLGGRTDLTEEVVGELNRQATATGVTIDAFNCSHHIAGGSPWDSTPSTLRAAVSFWGGPEGFIRRYFGEIRDAVSTGLFHCVSHIEAPRKFDPRAGLGPASVFAGAETVWLEELDRTLEALALAGVALEYNTGGLGTWGRPYVSPPALRRAAALGLRLALGSDAHHPAHIGRGFAEAAADLREAGLQEVWTFRAGEPVRIELT